MTVYINAKQLAKRRPQVAASRFELAAQPESLRALIRLLVLDSVAGYNTRIRRKDAPQPLSADTLEDMSSVGRIGFGISFGSREADPQEAVETAIRGFEDGLCRFFVGEREIESLDAPLALHDGDTITIIRLTMLTGGFFW